MNAVVVRRGSVDDVARLVEFNLAMALETENKRLDREVLRLGVARVLADANRGFYLVAECAGGICGCLMVTFEWSDWRNGDWWRLQSVYIDPAFRRRGVFRALHAQVESAARTTSGVVGLRLYVERENHRAQMTYASLGMHEAAYSMWENEYSRTI